MRRTACISWLLAAACHSGGAPMSSFGTLPVTTGSDSSTGTSGSDGGADGGSTSAVPEDSTSAASTGGGTTLVLDVGSADLGVPGPEGCRGKIDFLFVISRYGNNIKIQDKMIAALPKFMATIESRFADFDYHIMVVDGDEGWGVEYCNEYGCDLDECTVPNYPCEAIDSLTSCDMRYGAGTIFNAGTGTLNKPCPVVGDKRYIARGDPDPLGTFECIARVGLTGSFRIAGALVDALTPGKTGDCNAGFLRDDALLFVSLISVDTEWKDVGSLGTPEEWAQTVIGAKHGDPGAIVMLNIGPMSEMGWTDLESCADDWYWFGRLCRFIEYFPYRLAVDHLIPDYGVAFDEAAAMVGDACSAFIPR
jgi:hypothetical protein